MPDGSGRSRSVDIQSEFSPHSIPPAILSGPVTMQAPDPTPEHLWLQQLVGDWTVQSECRMAPDQPLMQFTRRESVRSLGSLWTMAEGFAQNPDSPADSVMTLGFDPQRQQFVGTFITSMMTYLWPYHGTLDQSARVLTLESEGPDATGDGGMTSYQDIIEVVSENERTLTSLILGKDGSWSTFMTARYQRVPSL